jgi:hypothetical protein
MTPADSALADCIRSLMNAAKCNDSILATSIQEVKDGQSYIWCALVLVAVWLILLTIWRYKGEES